MFENLLNLVKENAGDAIVNNPAIPNEHNDAAIETTGNSIMNTLKSQASSGNMDQLMNMFKGGTPDASNPIVNSVSNNVASDLMSKFGIDQGAASGIAAKLIPQVMNKFVNKTNDPNDSSFDIGGIMSSLTGGGAAGGIGGMISNLFK
ncbi:MAG: hypothetical protein ACRCYO_00950 [Bacteroidia bacterium]